MSDRPLNLGGRTRVLPSDFIVEEVWANRVCTIDASLVSRLRDGVLVKFRREKACVHKQNVLKRIFLSGYKKLICNDKLEI